MIRGTTTQFKFKLPCTKDDLWWATITVGQAGNTGTRGAPLPIVKKLSDCSTPNTSQELCVALDAVETQRFSEKLKAYVQFRACRKDGTVFGSRRKYLIVYPMADDILNQNDPIMPGPNDTKRVVFDGGAVSTQDDASTFALDAGSILDRDNLSSEGVVIFDAGDIGSVNNEPGNNESGDNEPDNNESDNNESGDNEPDNNEPNNNEPGNNESSDNESDDNESGDNDA